MSSTQLDNDENTNCSTSAKMKNLFTIDEMDKNDQTSLVDDKSNNDGWVYFR